MNPLKSKKTLKEHKAKVQRSAESFALRLLALFIFATLLSPAVGWLTSLDGDGGSPMIVEVNTPTSITDGTVTTITISVADASPNTTNTPDPVVPAPETVPVPPVESTVRGFCPKQLERCQHVHGGQQ